MPIQNIDSVMLKNWLEKDEVLLIDIREQWEYEAAAIPGALLVPLATVAPETIPDPLGKKLVLYCRSGIRSMKAAVIIGGFNPDLEVYNAVGGILQWAADGNTIEQH